MVGLLADRPLHRRTQPQRDQLLGFSEPTTHIAKNCEPPPYAWPSARRAPSTWWSPAAPRTWSAASPKRSMPEAPIGFEESTPPEQLTGIRPSIAVAPGSLSCQPPPSSAKPSDPSHIGAGHENGT